MSFDVEAFLRIRDIYGTTCIVTKEEDKELSEKHLRQSLPSACPQQEIKRKKYPKDNFNKMPEKVYDLEALDGDFVRYSGIIEYFTCKSSNGV